MCRFGTVDSLHHVPPLSALSDLSRPELEALLLELFGKVSGLEKIVAEQREEIARLKGLKGRPDIKPSRPSGMDRGTEPPKPAGKDKKRRRGKVAPRVAVEDRSVKVAVPQGSRFKGFEPFLVQGADSGYARSLPCRRQTPGVPGRALIMPR